MKTIRGFGWVAVILLLAGVAGAQHVVTVQDVVDYRDNLWDENVGVWFLVPQELSEDPCDWYEDHPPWHRGSNQDWGWTHDVSDVVPADANGIESATLTIMGWDVNSEEGEDDAILVNNQYLGMLTGLYRDWQEVSFTLPKTILDELWRDKKLYVFMDINQMVLGGFRVTLKSSTLSIRYYVSGKATPTTVPVYRFWSPVTSSHFYTINESEKDELIAKYPDVWVFEDAAYQAMSEAGTTGARPVYRFWSPLLSGHFYTISESEKDSIIKDYPLEVWTYEDIAFYAFAVGEQPSGTMPVHRFWSPSLGHHFYTMDEAEKDSIMKEYPPEVWTYEGIAWYAYPR